jgi:hypothetical protein
MILLITENKKEACNVAFFNVMGKVVMRKVFISIVVSKMATSDRQVSLKHCCINYQGIKFFMNLYGLGE